MAVVALRRRTTTYPTSPSSIGLTPPIFNPPTSNRLAPRTPDQHTSLGLYKLDVALRLRVTHRRLDLMIIASGSTAPPRTQS